jgi:hypothetical protein
MAREQLLLVASRRSQSQIHHPTGNKPDGLLCKLVHQQAEEGGPFTASKLVGRILRKPLGLHTNRPEALNHSRPVHRRVGWV